MDLSLRPRITRIRARNFRSIEFLDLELGDLTVLVGRNGAGKSNTVDVLRFIRDGADRGLEQGFLNRGGYQTIQRTGGKEVFVGVSVSGLGWECEHDAAFGSESISDRYEAIRVRLGGEGEWTCYDTDQVKEHVGKLLFPSKELPKDTFLSEGDLGDAFFRFVNQVDGEGRYRLRGGGGLIGKWHVPGYAADVIREASFYDFVPRPLRDPQRVVNPAPLDGHGANLLAVLRSILSGSDGDTLRQSLRQLVDGADDIEIQALGGHLVAEILYGAGGDGQAEPRRFDLGLESDGTIRLIAILAALYQSPSRTLIVLEEPERNIHPGALAILADVIREASTRSQILLTTHSPELIDCFEPEDLRVVERVEGATVVGPVDAAQQQAVRDNLFTAGEIMRIQGLQRDAEA